MKGIKLEMVELTIRLPKAVLDRAEAVGFSLEKGRTC